MIYTCEGCGSKLEATPEEAFELGWDTPERFMSHTTCETCPIDKTIWWKIQILKQPITDEEARLIQEYNRIYTEHQRQSS